MHYSLTWIQTKLNRDDIDDLTPDAVLAGVQKLNELIERDLSESGDGAG